jgi:hypothetical protein
MPPPPNPLKGGNRLWITYFPKKENTQTGTTGTNHIYENSIFGVVMSKKHIRPRTVLSENCILSGKSDAT